MKIRKISCYYLFLLFPFLFPATIGGLPLIGTVIKGYKIIAGLIAIYYTLKKHIMSRLVLVLSCFYGVICISALIHGLQIDNFIIDVLFLWLIDYLTHDKKSFSIFLQVYVGFYSVLMLINLATMVAFPKGLYASSAYNLNWFLGYKNVIIRLLLPYLTLMLTKKIVTNPNTKLSRKETFLCLATFVSIILSQSFNSLIGAVIYVLILWRNKSNERLGKNVITKAFTVYCITDFIMLKSNILSLFQNLIVNILDKNGSERARLAIWNHTLEMISKSPVIGYGGITNEMYNFAFRISHPHNLLLYYLMLGGVASIVILLIAMLCAEKAGKNVQSTKLIAINNLFTGMFCAYFSMGYMESLTGATMMIPMLVILYNLNMMGMEGDDDESRLMHTI